MRFLKLIEFENKFFIYDVDNFNLYEIEAHLYSLIKRNEI